jgi:hypothetical protein
MNNAILLKSVLHFLFFYVILCICTLKMPIKRKRFH